jgi:hypothetical protein
VTTAEKLQLAAVGEQRRGDREEPTKEAAAALGVSVDTFERRIQPFIRVVVCGQLILVPPAELERCVKDNARFLV